MTVKFEIENRELNFTNGDKAQLEGMALVLGSLGEYHAIGEEFDTRLNVTVDDDGREMLTSATGLMPWGNSCPAFKVAEDRNELFRQDFELSPQSALQMAEVKLRRPIIQGYGKKHTFSMLNFRHNRLPSAMLID